MVKILTRRVKLQGFSFEKSDEAGRQVLRMTCEKANSHGLLAFVRQVCARVNDAADGDAVGRDQFIQALSEEERRR